MQAQIISVGSHTSPPLALRTHPSPSFLLTLLGLKCLCSIWSSSFEILPSGSRQGSLPQDFASFPSLFPSKGGQALWGTCVWVGFQPLERRQILHPFLVAVTAKRRSASGSAGPCSAPSTGCCAVLQPLRSGSGRGWRLVPQRPERSSLLCACNAWRRLSAAPRTGPCSISPNWRRPVCPLVP